ncbi:S1/P1 nuclease [Lutibacter sp. TH_r2]|uniref:S1/P1 nuclease n=1 Tax=Lutibacter sp. TH_r2 TaxID=3082083 RepID=UPI00295542F3|nr:S1/P1 nuclease [Lutibacter sp. TH_r2]MDV7185704.1 S1/P1 nuclease [Lutibacter sp. TH_r2]
MKKVIVIIAVFFIIPLKANNPNWGQTGHRTIGDIATKYLKGKTKRNINEILDGQSLVIVSTYADEIKSDRKYSKYSVWHYVNKPFEKTYQDAEKNPKGDLVTGIKECVAILKNKKSSKEAKAFHLKMLVHLIGDLHQPMHVGLREDKGGNDFQVQWFGKGTNLHSVWDSKMLDSYNMSYSELTTNIPEFSKEQIKFIQKGTFEDWVNETGELAKITYGSAKSGENLSYRYMYNHFKLATEQLQKGGIRLAKVLNDIFA